MTYATVVQLCGVAHCGILTASFQVPHRLQWKEKLACLDTIHRQMYWTYAIWTLFGILFLGLGSAIASDEIATGTRLGRCFCAYGMVFWGCRLPLQYVFDSKPFLTNVWLKIGYNLLTVLFVVFTLVYGYGVFHDIR